MEPVQLSDLGHDVFCGWECILANFFSVKNLIEVSFNSVSFQFWLEVSFIIPPIS